MGTDRWRSEPPCAYLSAKAGHVAKRRVGVEYSPSMLKPVRPGAVSPDMALCLSTFIHFAIVKKTSRALTLSKERAPQGPPSHTWVLPSGGTKEDKSAQRRCYPTGRCALSHTHTFSHSEPTGSPGVANEQGGGLLTYNSKHPYCVMSMNSPDPTHSSSSFSSSDPQPVPAFQKKWPMSAPE
jgi:hypothetical protein